MIKNRQTLKVAIIHDWIINKRGAEKVLDHLCSMFPTADVYILFGKKETIDSIQNLKSHKIYFSFLLKFPFILKYYRYTYFLWPLAIEQFDLKNYDLVISNSFSVAKGVITGINTKHIAYINSPMRYAWDMTHDYFSPKYFSKLKRVIINFFLHYIRIWDSSSNDRVDKIIANSEFVAKRIEKYYRLKPTAIIYPPVDVTKAYTSKMKDFFLYFGALEPNKGVLETVEAAIKYGFKLKIAGNGSLLKNIQRRIKGKKNIELITDVDEKTKWELLSQAKVLIFLSIEDSGIVPLESTACGTPVLAFSRGGSLETVREGINGIHIDSRNPEEIFEGLKKMEKEKYDIKEMEKWVKKFGPEIFKRKIEEQMGF